MFQTTTKKKPKKQLSYKHRSSPENYEKFKSKRAEISRQRSIEGRDIGAIPPVVNPERKAYCERDFRLFCETYLPMTFVLKWSPDHLKVIAKTELAVLHGGLFAMAMPRGSGKSSICSAACLWATLYGHREFVCFIGSDEGRAGEMLTDVKSELESNDLLFEDFPEAVYPIRQLEGIANRCKGQTCNGKRTRITWTADEVIMPTIAGSHASGAIIKVAGITGGIRGMKHKRADGKTVRPSLVVCDDIQTDESSRSASQCVIRESILAGAILGLAGPGKKISGIMPCTVISPGDVADNILNRDKHPEWNGERMKMVYSFPTNEGLWEKYKNIRADSFRAGTGGAEATRLYAENRVLMDAGAIVAWPERHNHDELSALQHAMNLKFQNERAFFSEYQNDPLPIDAAAQDELTADQIIERINRVPRGVIPIGGSRLTAFIDVQGNLLYWLVAAWSDHFDGFIVDYGAFPDQGRTYFNLSDAKKTMAMVLNTSGTEATIYAGLGKLCDSLLTRAWRREDAAEMKIERLLIDANWGESTDVVYQFCRQSPYASVLMPSHGKGVGASSQPFAEYKRKPGERAGHNWRIPNVTGKRVIRYALYDTNYWKSFIHARLSVGMGGRGGLSLFGDKPEVHRMLADHLTAERAIRTEARGRKVDEWKIRGDRRDNHFLDALAGSAIAASIQGVALMEQSFKVVTKKRVSFADMQKGRR